MITRRRLLSLVPAAAVCARIDAQVGIFKRKPKPKPPLPPALVYFGTDTAKPGARGVYRSYFDPNRGQLSAPVLAAPTLRPAFMALNEIPAAKPAQDRHVLYVCNEGEGKTATITTYQVNLATGALTQLGQVSAGANGPCYISVDATGHSAYVADYAGGMVASYSVRPDGTLTEPVDRVDFHNQAIFGHPGPNKARQDGPHPHSANISPDNRFIVVNDLGNDDIAIFPIDPGNQTAHLGHPHLFTGLSPGTGPRHIAFHPNERWAYGIDELANRIDQYLYTSMRAAPGVEAQGLLTAADHSVSTIDENFHGTNTAAEIAVVPTGDFLYASNRGEDSLAVFKIEETTGMLSFVQRISCGGKTPRHFTLDRTGNWLLCGNQDSASVTVFSRNAGTGKLTGPVQTVPLESPMFTLFV